MSNRILVRMAIAAVGLVVTLAWWSWRGTGSHHKSEAAASIPPKVWAGGTPVTLTAELSHPGRVRATFATNSAVGDPNARTLATWQAVPAGRHEFVISVPPDVGGSAEVEIDHPPVGAKVRIELHAGDKVATDEGELAAPLKANEAFFAQLELDDWATVKKEGEAAPGEPGEPEEQ